MPNWCNNRLVVNNGEKISSELKSFLENGFSFEKIIPVNGKTVDTQSDAWSTKWDLNEEDQMNCSISLIEDSECQFDTAWSPPEKVIQELSKKFPNDSFKLSFMESGMQFAGTIYYDNGSSYEDSVDFNKEELLPFMVNEMGWDNEEADDFFID